MNAIVDGDGLLFIIGHYKSGSSWLLHSLSLHPAIRGLHETWIVSETAQAATVAECIERLLYAVPFGEGGPRNFAFYRAMRLVRRCSPWPGPYALDPADRPIVLLDLGLAQQRALRRAIRGAVSGDDLCRRFFSTLSEQLQPRRYLLEKTPHNIHHHARIRGLFPRAKLVAIHRDGRDVVVSDRFFSRDRLGQTGWSFEQSVRKWRADMEANLAARRAGPLFSCSYEMLTRNGRDVLRSLLAFLELPADDDVVADMMERSSFRFHSGRDVGQENRRRFARKGIIGDWRNHFTEADKRLFKEIAGEMLVELGYERNSDW